MELYILFSYYYDHILNFDDAAAAAAAAVAFLVVVGIDVFFS